MRKLCCACFVLAGMLVVGSESCGMNSLFKGLQQTGMNLRSLASNLTLDVFQQLNEKNSVKQEVNDSNKRWITATKNWNQGGLIIDTEHGNPQHVGQLYIAYKGDEYWVNAGQAYNNTLFSCKVGKNGWSHLNIREGNIALDWSGHTLSVNGSNINVKCGIRSGNLHILGQNKFAQNAAICGTNMINIFGKVIATSDFKSISYHQYCHGFITDTDGGSDFVVDKTHLSRMFEKSNGTLQNDLNAKSGANGAVRQPAFFDMGHIYLSKDKKVRMVNLDFRSCGSELTAESVTQEGAHQSFYVNNDAFDGEFHRFWHYYFYPTHEFNVDIKHLTSRAVYVNSQQQQRQNGADFIKQSDFYEVRNPTTGTIENSLASSDAHSFCKKVDKKFGNNQNGKKQRFRNRYEFINMDDSQQPHIRTLLAKYGDNAKEIYVSYVDIGKDNSVFFVNQNGENIPFSYLVDKYLFVELGRYNGMDDTAKAAVKTRMLTVSYLDNDDDLEPNGGNDDSDSDSESSDTEF